MEKKTNNKAVISFVHPLCDNNIRLVLPVGDRSNYRVHCVLAIHYYITKQYSKLAHYKGGIYPILTRTELTEKNFLSYGKRLVGYVLSVLKEANSLFLVNKEHQNPEKVQRLYEVKERIVEFLTVHMSDYVFDLPFMTYESIPQHIRNEMVQSYIKKRFPDVISGDVIIKKFEKTMSFSNFADINILLRYTTFLHNRLKKKEKAMEDFMKREFRYDPFYNNFIRQTKVHYYSLYPERKIVVRPSSTPVRHSNSSQIPSNVVMRYSRVPVTTAETNAKPPSISTSIFTGVSTGVSTSASAPVAVSTPKRVSFNEVAQMLASIQSNSINSSTSVVSNSSPEGDSPTDDVEKKELLDVFVPETDDEADSEGTDSDTRVISRKRVREKDKFTSVAEAAKRRRR